jgi:RimJ/RimL family protein N-acetyltransferase
MLKLEEKNYHIIKNLIKNSSQELSILSVINGVMPGEVFVDCEDNPTTVLIQTSECNLLAGNPNNEKFNSEVKEELDFWDGFIIDTDEWEAKISEVHENKFIRKYKRRHYILSKLKYDDYKQHVKKGFSLEKVDPSYLSKCNLKNWEKVMDWVNNWGSIENFNKYGAGFMIRNEDTIVSWSLTDCIYDKRAAIGVHCDPNYRKNGFGAIAAAATADYCLCNGITEIDWSCVDTNVGSIAIAEKLGFVRKNDYYAFTSYPPIENRSDLTLEQWEEWALFYEKVLEEEPRLFWDCALCWMKANNVDPVIKLLNKKVETGWKWTVDELSEFFPHFHSNSKWGEYLKHLEILWK